MSWELIKYILNILKISLMKQGCSSGTEFIRVRSGGVHVHFVHRPCMMLYRSVSKNFWKKYSHFHPNLKSPFRFSSGISWKIPLSSFPSHTYPEQRIGFSKCLRRSEGFNIKLKNGTVKYFTKKE